MNIKLKTKKYLISAGIAATMIATTAGIASAHMGVLGAVDKTAFAGELATHFNLNQADVNAFLKSRMQSQMQARLDKAVTDGKITAAQEQAIITEQGVISARMTTIAAITDQTARQAAITALHDDVKAWVTANNIPVGFMMEGGMGHGMGGGFGRGHMYK